jgi:peroxiredoxin
MKTPRQILAFLLSLLVSATSVAQNQSTVRTDQEKPIFEELHKLRDLPKDSRAQITLTLALQIRRLPPTPNKLDLAMTLAELSTEGDFGHEALQEVATTLEQTIREQPSSSQDAYVQLATLVRYEHVSATIESPQYAAAIAKLEADDQRRQGADFALTDLRGKTWSLRALRGKVVLVNFWSTWCTPCRTEMPDLEALYEQFKSQGLIILGVASYNNPITLDATKSFAAKLGIAYPILLDPGYKVAHSFEVIGIPKSFVYDHNGKLVAEAMDMRTRAQFLTMLARAGLK